ncbi:MAG: hypothetical protein KDA28_04660 [Phycisphaerales bacterium]|nr:hypothetical protein [Phycisphaerales bacterium]
MKRCILLIALGASTAFGQFQSGGTANDSDNPRRARGHTDQGNLGGPSTIGIDLLRPGGNGERLRGNEIIIDFNGTQIGGAGGIGFGPLVMTSGDGGPTHADRGAPTSSVVPAPGAALLLIGGTLAARRRRH